MASATPNIAGDTSMGPGVTDETYYFAAAATAGDTIVVDMGTTTTSTGNTLNAGQAAKKAPATSDLSYVLGGLLATVTAGSWGKVRRSGVQTSVACKSNVAQYDAIKTSTDAAGRVDAAANTDINVVGVALTAASSNTCTVLWRTL